MSNHIAGKSIIVTGAAGGFGKLVAGQAAAMGAKVTCGDVRLDEVEKVAAELRAVGHDAQAFKADVTDLANMKDLANAAVSAFGAIDVMINNAGTMPLAFIGDHERAAEAWNRCIDTNFKGVVNGSIAVYNQMMRQERGHVINLSSIYGNHPVVGSAIYGATKAAVNYFSNSLRVETRGKIKVTIVKPTGVAGTGLGGSIINPEAAVGIMGHNASAGSDLRVALESGTMPASQLDPANIGYLMLAPEYIADAILHVIDQPWGVSISEVTVRAAGDYFIL